jgi:uncharacterized protein (DUF362 family)
MKKIKRREFLKKMAAIGEIGFMVPFLPKSLKKHLIFIQQAHAENISAEVVSVRDTNASDYDYATGYFWEHVDQKTVTAMVEKGVMELTGTTTIAEAWNGLIPYSEGENVLIKFNFNNSRKCSIAENAIDPIPETANAIIEGLTRIGIPGSSIWITDPSRRVTQRFREGIHNPDIQYYSSGDCPDDPNYHVVPFVAADSTAASMATNPSGEKILPSQIFVDADHLINIPILKSHGSYVTLALKNHYGSIAFENYNLSTMHQFFNQGNYAGPLDLNEKNILADINNNPHIKEKTRLVLGDGIFGNPHNHWQGPERWTIFGNDDPSILFFSTDPVAVSSIMTDYIMEERGWQDHQQLHAAQHIGIGVHEHWDNFSNKHYASIDYSHFDLNNPTVDDGGDSGGGGGCFVDAIKI